MSDTDDKRRTAKVAQESHAEDLRKIMATPGGRRWIGKLIDSCGILQGGFVGSSEVYYRQGRRDVGLQIMQELQAFCPDEYIQMLQEARAK